MDSQSKADQVGLLVDGKEHQIWTYYRLTSDLLTPADSWQVSLGLPDGAFPPGVRPGARVQVRVGTDTVMQGRIDDVTRAVARPARSLEMFGRDDAAVLIDCSAPIFVAKEVSLAEIIANVVRPLGISQVRVDADSLGGTTEKVTVEPGIKAWDLLAQAAEANGLWPWFEPDGTLVVGGPDYTTEPVATLIERRDGKGNNVLSLSHSDSIADRYSEVTVLAQAHGTGVGNGLHGIKASTQDTSLGVYRPLIVSDGDLQSHEMAQLRARKHLTDGRLYGLTLTAAVKGHRTSRGGLWTPGQRIHVKSESLGIDAIWFLMGREFVGGRGTQTLTVLTLKEDGVWVLDAYKKKRTGRKGKKLQAVVIDVS
ncbi:phage baseplate assembly protein [Achromobacter anxifer]